MIVKTYTNNNGQLVSDYSEEKPNEYLDFIKKRMSEKEKSQKQYRLDYKEISDELLIETRFKLEKNPRANVKRLFVLYNEMTRRKL